MIGKMAEQAQAPTPVPTPGTPKTVPEEGWDEVISSLSGTVHRGIEKIKSAQVLAALRLSGNKECGGKRAGIAMRSRGWRGPQMLRFADGTHGSGFCRGGSDDDDADATSMSASTSTSMSVSALAGPPAPEPSLPEQLEKGSRESVRWARAVLRWPLDVENGNLCRMQGTAANLLMGTQVRVDQARLRAQQSNDILDRLEKLLRKTERSIPLEPTAIPPMPLPRSRAKGARGKDEDPLEKLDVAADTASEPTEPASDEAAGREPV